MTPPVAWQSRQVRREDQGDPVLPQDIAIFGGDIAEIPPGRRKCSFLLGRTMRSGEYHVSLIPTTLQRFGEKACRAVGNPGVAQKLTCLAESQQQASIFVNLILD